MNETERTVTETDLHAFADGLLDAAEHARVEAWLNENPKDADVVAAWQAQNAGIKSLFAPYGITKGTDRSMISVVPSRSEVLPKRLLIFAGVAAVFIVGIAAGHFLPPFTARPALQLEASLPQQAQSAFAVYASEVRQPVQTSGDLEPRLAKWLGQRLAIPDLKVPDLQMLGFQLVGGWLLPVNETPGAMFVYENSAGKRLTVMVGRNKTNQTTSFRFANTGTVDTFYWINGELGYAVTGEISRDMLQQVAEQCYEQFPS